MSSDLLRRAAVKLRTAAEAAPEGPWVSLNDGDRLVALRPDSTFEKGFRYLVDEPIDDTSIAEYFALMHPPVALALAAAMDEVAFAVSVNPDTEHRVGYGELIACARAVLREPEETP